MKKCSSCKKIKPRKQFFRSSKANDGLLWDCKECDIKRRTRNRKKNWSGYRNSVLLKKFGISLKDYNKILKSQDNKCAICKTHKNKFNEALCVDHNHITNGIRGILCHHCNKGLGHLRCDKGIRLLKSAIRYISKYD